MIEWGVSGVGTKGVLEGESWSWEKRSREGARHESRTRNRCVQEWQERDRTRLNVVGQQRWAWVAGLRTGSGKISIQKSRVWVWLRRFTTLGSTRNWQSLETSAGEWVGRSHATPSLRYTQTHNQTGGTNWGQTLNYKKGENTREDKGKLGTANPDSNVPAMGKITLDNWTKDSCGNFAVDTLGPQKEIRNIRGRFGRNLLGINQMNPFMILTFIQPMCRF